MARLISLKATLNFDIESQEDYDGMRTLAKNFAAANNGQAVFTAHEEGDSYFAKLFLTFEGLTRGGAAALMTTIDNQLENLPDLIATNGFGLRYEFVEIEDCKE